MEPCRKMSQNHFKPFKRLLMGTICTRIKSNSQDFKFSFFIIFEEVLSTTIRKSILNIILIQYYRVSEPKWTQEKCCCELVLGLLGPQRTSMWPQDWAQITFRSEILSNIFKNEAGRWLAKGQKSGSGDLSMIYRVSQNEFLLKSFTPKTLWLLILVYKDVLVKELTTNYFCQD